MVAVYMSDKIYVLGSNQTGAKFYFINLEIAQAALAHKANKVKHAPGVECFKQGLHEISWVFGWEEAHVSFSIKEFPITTSVKEIEGLL